MFQILIVEDDTELLNLYSTVLEKQGYSTHKAENGIEALELLDHQYVDLMICDIMMPKMNGYILTEMVREADYHFPILMITAKSAYKDMEKGFRSGSDDYMIKPININEMILRVEALLRRAQINVDKELIIGDTVFDSKSLTVTSSDNTLLLPQKEFFLLYKLVSYPNQIFTRYQLMEEIWGMDSDSDTHTVDVHISRLRDKFKDNHDFEIVTIRGLGYKVVQNK